VTITKTLAYYTKILFTFVKGFICPHEELKVKITPFSKYFPGTNALAYLKPVGVTIKKDL
jgi:hypothetical protein